MKSPAETLRELAEFCQDETIDRWDVYGDFDASQDASSSFLRRFEAELAQELNKEDALFLPSGTMAQQIALLIHHSNHHDNRNKIFACHPTSHLLLHEEDAYRELSGMEALVIHHHDSIEEEGSDDEDSNQRQRLSIPPLLFADVQRTLDHEIENNKKPSTLILELPHREIGGQLPPWNDVVRMSDYCQQQRIRLHCDGARLFEAAAGYGMPLAEVAAPFDSVYISFYKGLGGMAGSVLVGDKTFIAEARVWLRRFGGNLFTLLPYAVSGMVGYRKYWKPTTASPTTPEVLSFAEKKAKLCALVQALEQDDMVPQVVAFDPSPPHTNLVHAYFFGVSAEQCLRAADTARQQTDSGVRVLHRVRDLLPDKTINPACARGYRSKMEWTLGEANGRVPEDVVVEAWRAFARALLLLKEDEKDDGDDDVTDSSSSDKKEDSQ